MIYGEEKVRTMARSILPATNRKDARTTAAAIKRTNRRRTRQALHDWKRHADPYDYEGHILDYGEPCGGASHWDAHTIKEAMWDRRQHDKLSHMVKWAIEYTAHLDDPEDRYMLMKKVLPDNLIGRHALSHLDYLEEFDFQGNAWWRYGNYRRPEPVEVDEVELRNLITLRLGELNRAIATYNKREFPLSKDEAKRIPKCQGIHDTEFVHRCRRSNSAERNVVLKMLGHEVPPAAKDYRAMLRAQRLGA